MNAPVDDNRGLFAALAADGRPLVSLTGVALILSGGFALFLSATKQFLPHDVAFLGMTPEALCAINECRIVHFMIHDRVSFGGALIGIGTLYLWLAEFPLRRGEAWAWWLLLASGGAGFGSFLLYLGYGYLDTWHGLATLALLPCFALGLWKSRSGLHAPRSIGALARPSAPLAWKSAYDLGRLALLGTALGLSVAGLVISIVGATTVFVPQDLEYMGMTVEELRAANPRLVPLIAHDRAGFGGGVCCGGLTTFFCVWCGRPSRSLWQALFVAGAVGFGTAIFIHPAIGYTDFVHLAPAYAGAVSFAIGIALTFHSMNNVAPPTAASGTSAGASSAR